MRQEIRIVRAEDAGRYWELRLEALRTESRAFGRAAEEHESTSVEEAAERIREMPEETFLLGAFDADELVGTAMFSRETSVKERHKGHVYGVFVRKGFRGRGIGFAMLSELIARARLQPTLEQILLAVTTVQAAALGLYRKLGFETYGTEPRALKNGDEYLVRL